MEEAIEVVNGVLTTPAQPNILRGRKNLNTLGRVATIMFTHTSANLGPAIDHYIMVYSAVVP